MIAVWCRNHDAVPSDHTCDVMESGEVYRRPPSCGSVKKQAASRGVMNFCGVQNGHAGEHFFLDPADLCPGCGIDPDAGWGRNHRPECVCPDCAAPTGEYHQPGCDYSVLLPRPADYWYGAFSMGGIGDGPKVCEWWASGRPGDLCVMDEGHDGECVTGEVANALASQEFLALMDFRRVTEEAAACPEAGGEVPEVLMDWRPDGVESEALCGAHSPEAKKDYCWLPKGHTGMLHAWSPGDAVDVVDRWRTALLMERSTCSSVNSVGTPCTRPLGHRTYHTNSGADARGKPVWNDCQIPHPMHADSESPCLLQADHAGSCVVTTKIAVAMDEAALQHAAGLAWSLLAGAEAMGRFLVTCHHMRSSDQWRCGRPFGHSGDHEWSLEPRELPPSPAQPEPWSAENWRHRRRLDI